MNDTFNALISLSDDRVSNRATRDWAPYILVVALSSYYIVLLSVNYICNETIGNTSFDSMFVFVTLAAVALSSIIPISRRLGRWSIIIALMIMISLAATCYRGSGYASIILAEAPKFVLTVLPCIFVGNYLSNFSRLDFIYQRILPLCCILSLIYVLGTSTGYVHDIVGAYSVLPMSIIACYYALFQTNLLSVAIAVCFGLCVLILGVRGPLIIFLGCLAALLFKKQRTSARKTLLVLMSCALACFIASPAFVDMVTNIDVYLSSYGVANATLKTMRENVFFDPNGRDVIATALLQRVFDNPFGAGLFSDRVEIGIYAHNVLIEILVDYGLLLGMILIALLAYGSTRLLINVYRNDFLYSFVLSVMTTGLFELFFSGSYLESQNFFLLIGLILNSSLMRVREFSSSNARIRK